MGILPRLIRRFGNRPGIIQTPELRTRFGGTADSSGGTGRVNLDRQPPSPSRRFPQVAATWRQTPAFVDRPDAYDRRREIANLLFSTARHLGTSRHAPRLLAAMPSWVANFPGHEAPGAACWGTLAVMMIVLEGPAARAQESAKPPAATRRIYLDEFRPQAGPQKPRSIRSRRRNTPASTSISIRKNTRRGTG